VDKNKAVLLPLYEGIVTDWPEFFKQKSFPIYGRAFKIII
jgi:hypothetical protein